PKMEPNFTRFSEVHPADRGLVPRPEPPALMFGRSSLNLCRMARSPAHQAASRGALVVRAPELGTIAVTGRDRQSWLNGLVTSDLAQLAPGTASYGLVLVKVGRIVSDVWVVPAGERLLVGAPRDRVGALREHFERYLMMEDATHADASGELGWVFAHGPRS